MTQRYTKTHVEAKYLRLKAQAENYDLDTSEWQLYSSPGSYRFRYGRGTHFYLGKTAREATLYLDHMLDGFCLRGLMPRKIVAEIDGSETPTFHNSDPDYSVNHN